jgi:predicted lysophospholipase L1 biosynthesis ABC-type transport system permease subunit
MAKAAFPGEDPIGKRIFFDYEVQRGRIQNVPVPRYEIVGIVGDVRASISQEPAPAMYRPLLDSGNPAVSLLLHTQGDSQAAVNTVRNEIRKFNSSLAVSRIQTMEEIIGTSTADRQFSMFLFLTFAGLALLLATIGLYGLVSYAVSQRKAEIGIRMALGATARDVRTLVVLDGLKPAIAGLILGTIAAVFATPILRTQLFGITPGDPLTFSSVALLLLAVAGVACYLPAIRATRLDPTVALRAE